eukprot:CAMPEP_0176118936 /NCGR_PEP_ID=MMETSP0120_2-20121206/59789_1 /TAXON_ID=160619 /ORGANISM="Kryptoperidinium foliaceum, Strain CCMP 1326" /LENGTH=64 /DNA_ID=CAMNT_0017453311 /DNA_START=64 /DNA_END=255 /DNA_ORIENTATION=-
MQRGSQDNTSSPGVDHRRRRRLRPVARDGIPGGAYEGCGECLRPLPQGRRPPRIRAAGDARCML